MTPNRGHLAKRSAKGCQVQLKACRVERNAYQAQRKGVPNAAQGVPNAAQRGAKGSATRAKRSAGHGKCSAKACQVQCKGVPSVAQWVPRPAKCTTKAIFRIPCGAFLNLFTSRERRRESERLKKLFDCLPKLTSTVQSQIHLNFERSVLRYVQDAPRTQNQGQDKVETLYPKF